MRGLVNGPRIYERPGYLVLVLTISYMLAFIDRQILSLLVAPIRKDLEIGDVQVSLLQGMAFALIYGLCALPAGRLADRHNRSILIAIGVCLWSTMTALCGFASSFGRLFLARAGVGLGESILSPAAYSLLADAHRPRDLPRALSFYAIGGLIGVGLGYIAGGAVVSYASNDATVTLPIFGALKAWQAVFVLVALPGALVGCLALTIREPARRDLLRDQRRGAVAKVSVAEVLRFVARRWQGYGMLTAGLSALSVFGYGYFSWYPTYLIRCHGFSAANAGILLGVIFVVFGPLGAICAPKLAAFLRERGHADANPRAVLVSALLLVAFSGGTLVPDGTLAVVAGIPVAAILGSYLGLTVAALQLVTPNQMRAFVSAIFQLCVTVLGLGLGPTFIALLTERFFANDLALDRSLAIAAAVCGLTASTVFWLGLPAYRNMLAEAELWRDEPNDPGVPRRPLVGTPERA